MTGKTNPVYDFGAFRIDTKNRVLLRHGSTIPLPPKAFDTLLLLIEHRNEVLSKPGMMKRLWGETTVEGANLTQQIFTVRRALASDGESEQFIETIPRRGYRFAAAVCELDSKVSSEQSPPPVIIVGAPKETIRLRWIAALTLAATSLLAMSPAWQRMWPRNTPAPAKIMLAVLPFSNFTGDPQQKYFSNGLTEEMITQLGSLEPNRLGVIARTSAMQYEDTKKDVHEVGRELGVDYILEGSVRRQGDQVRITAQLIQVKDQTHLWARDYDRNSRDILALQNEVAGEIAREIKLKLTPEERTRLAKPLSLDPEAHELYLKGRYFWNKRNEDGFVKAIKYFQQAIANEPTYAQAYAGLADAYALLGSMSNLEMSRAEAMPKAKAAALQALKLDDSLAEAHTSLAFVEMHYEWDWPNSEREFKRALELNPNYATAHQWYAVWLMAQGKTAAALEEERLAQQADPLSTIIKTDTAQLLVCAGRFDEAAQQAKKALEIDPNFWLGHIYLGQAYRGKRDYPAALAEFQEALDLSRDNIQIFPSFIGVYAAQGQRDKVEAILHILQKADHRSRDRADYDIQLASVYATLGQNDRAFASLDEARQYRSGSLILLNAAPEFQSLRPDPRFADLERRVGLPLITHPQ